MGALNRVVKPDALMPAARELAKTMAAKSRDALAASKRDINAVFFGQRPFEGASVASGPGVSSLSGATGHKLPAAISAKYFLCVVLVG